MSKKHKRPRAGSGVAPREQGIQALERRAEGAQAARRWRDAITAYKALLKQEDRADWRSELAAAYAGRAGELTAKGMLKEALAIWENRAALEVDAPVAPGHLTLLMRLGRLDTLIAMLCDDADGLPREQLRALLAARVLGGDLGLLERLPEADPVRRHSEAALAALAAYCEHDDDAVRAALARIPFRSPYRDWVQLIKALLQAQTPTQARTLLDRIDDDSPFAPLKRAMALSLLPATAFPGATEGAAATETEVACVLRGWSPERIAIWQELQRLGTSPSPRALIRLLVRHRDALGADWVRTKSLLFAAQGDIREAMRLLSEAGFARPSAFEQALLVAHRSDPHRDPWEALDAWGQCAELLAQQAGKSKDPNLALRVALLLRRADTLGDLLANAAPSGDPDDFESIAAEQLEQSLRWDPDHRATYLRLIAYHRRGRQLKEARRLLQQAQQRWPQDMALLEAAMDIALDAGSFKKAAGLARQILAIDPINSGVRRRLVAANLSHARKQAAKGRTDLAHKELDSAAEWARDERTRERIGLTTALLSIIDEDQAGIDALRGQVATGDSGLHDRLELMLAADALGLWQGRVNSLLGLKRPKVVDQADLTATLARLRLALEEDQALSRETTEGLNAALLKARWSALSRTELEAACNTLQRSRLDKTREQVATQALKRWRGEPIFELHRFEARYPRGFDFRSTKDLQALETAMERARNDGDKRTAMRIMELLPMGAGHLGFGGPPAPFPPMPFPFFDLDEDDDEGLPEDILDLIQTLGPKGALEALGAPRQLIREIGRLERELGREAAIAVFINMLGQMDDFDSFDGLPFPPEPRRGRGKAKGKGRQDPDDDDPPEQFELF